jgi:hypothetical protein
MGSCTHSGQYVQNAQPLTPQPVKCLPSIAGPLQAMLSDGDDDEDDDDDAVPLGMDDGEGDDDGDGDGEGEGGGEGEALRVAVPMSKKDQERKLKREQEKKRMDGSKKEASQQLEDDSEDDAVKVRFAVVG